MPPAYLDEKRYAYHVFSWARPAFDDYQPADAQAEFEKRVQDTYVQGNAYLRQEEYYLALTTFRQLQNLVLSQIRPSLPLDAYLDPAVRFPLDVTMVDALAAHTAATLNSLPIKSFRLPDAEVADPSPLPDGVVQALGRAEAGGLAMSADRTKLAETIGRAGTLAQAGDWLGTKTALQQALDQTPAADTAVQASLLHDLAIASEKAGDPKDQAATFGTRSAALFGQASVFDAQVDSLQTVAAIQSRAGNADAATQIASQAGDVATAHNLFPVVVTGTAATVPPAMATTSPSTAVLGATHVSPGALHALQGHAFAPEAAGAGAAGAPPALAAAVTDGAAGGITVAPQLFLDRFLATVPQERTFEIAGAASTATLSLSGDVTQNVKGFLQTLATTRDLDLLRWHSRSYIEYTAYLPSMYYFTLPMAIGDALVGLGNYEEAAASYASVLPYPYLNEAFEVVSVWTKLAGVYLELGDLAYRNARDSVADFGAARGWYEKIVKSDGTLDAASPLYADAKFADLTARVNAFIAAGLKSDTDDNPQVLSKVLEASVKLAQIAQGLNFFGFSADYAPPFSWEYLQTTARYFAQQSSQIEQRYIQFKTAAESETLQRREMDQQAEVARQTVALEQRGAAEAQAAMAVAGATLNYANVQRNNAVQARDQFAAVRDQLYEYAVQEAWANAAAVDKDDEVKLTMTGFSYYNPSGERRSLVIQDLEARRTAITHDMEASRLQRDVDATTAYIGVAQAEAAEAKARLDIANQRIAIAQLQQRDAQENRDFLDMKEFSAQLWFDVAGAARRVSQRYLDMATEVAFLAERAYNAETGRNLSVIRYDYTHSAADNLMGGDFLALDLDYLTLDHATTTRTKKLPVKRVLSLADLFPTALQRLRDMGSCSFQTELGLFDRAAPGMYLCKMRNAEVLFLGVRADAIAGTLRNLGVSRFRDAAGNVTSRVYPADVMALSRYDLRQDALAFPVNPNELRLFENHGIDTVWQLDLPLDANDLDFHDLLDVQLVLYYDGFFDPTLEQTVRAALPSGGTGTRVLSMRLSFPDELFYLRSNGEAELAIDASLFPRTQTNLVRRASHLRLTGDAATTQGLTIRLASQALGQELVLKTDANGEIDGRAGGQPLAPLNGTSVLDTWTLRISAADNPSLVTDGKLVLKGLADLMAFVEYDFTYR